MKVMSWFKNLIKRNIHAYFVVYGQGNLKYGHTVLIMNYLLALIK